MDITTERLVLRDFVEDDLEAIVAWRIDPDVLRFLDITEPPTIDGAQDFLANAMRYNAQVPRESYNWAITLRTSGEAIGWFGIGPSSERKREFGHYDFGYALAKAHWGNGYAVEALRAVIDFALGELGATSVFGDCHEPNVQSARVMEKAGLTPMGKAPWDPRSVWFQVRTT